ncbi:MAG: hypothetical protein CFE27_09815 [Alphaproteobacteria bacterium PA1]|nr:MAG: hypothetical protein CFE27_09815 [Alphaproteobacteria bacterium PA1]
MWELAKSKRIWVASLCASAYATIPFVLLPAYFVLITFAIKLGRQRGISYFDVPLYGAHLALRVLSAIALAGALRLNFFGVMKGCVARPETSSALFESETAVAAATKAIALINCFEANKQANDDLTNLIRAFVFCSLIWIWIKHDRRLLTVAQLGMTAIVAFAALLMNAALTPRPWGSVAVGWPPALVWDRLDLTAIFLSYSEITLQVFIVAFVGYLLGHLCAPCLAPSGSLPNRIYFSLGSRANWIFAGRLQRYQILMGLVAAALLAVLFTTKNSALYGNYPLDWRYAYDDNLIARFNSDALKTGLSGAFEVLPFIAAGAIMVWLLGMVRLAGILPILVVGAIMGRIAGVMIQPQYQTPFLTPLDGATLIGMIVAAGFGAAANAFGFRPSQNKTDTSGNQPI